MIAATDRRIDALVYELYGLTADEIKIVEEGTEDSMAEKPILFGGHARFEMKRRGISPTRLQDQQDQEILEGRRMK